MTWSVRIIDPDDQDGVPLSATEFDDPGMARQAYEALCEKANIEGGAYELHNGVKWVSRHIVTLPEVKA